MYKINDYIIYKKEVCKIYENIEKYLNSEAYYLLEQLANNSLKIKVTTDSLNIVN